MYIGRLAWRLTTREDWNLIVVLNWLVQQSERHHYIVLVLPYAHWCMLKQACNSWLWKFCYQMENINNSWACVVCLSSYQNLSVSLSQPFCAHHNDQAQCLIHRSNNANGINTVWSLSGISQLCSISGRKGVNSSSHTLLICQHAHQQVFLHSRGTLNFVPVTYCVACGDAYEEDGATDYTYVNAAILKSEDSSDSPHGIARWIVAPGKSLGRCDVRLIPQLRCNNKSRCRLQHDTPGGRSGGRSVYDTY